MAYRTFVKKLLTAAAFMAAFFMPAQARMVPVQLPMNLICFDTLEEGFDFHKRAGQFPIIKGTTKSSGTPGGAILFLNPENTNWSFMMFKTNAEGRTVPCIVTTGELFEIVPTQENKIQL